MKRLAKIFAVMVLAISPAFADTLPVAASKQYVDEGLSQKATAIAESVSANYIPLSQKGAANGVATLDGTGKVPSSQLPSDIGAQSDWNQASSSAVDFIKNKPTLGTAAAKNVEYFADAAQGALADSAVQPGDLALVATTNSYDDLDDLPTLGTAAAADTTDFAAASSLANYIPTSQKGVASGVASLDGTGKVPSSQLPAQVQSNWTQATSSEPDFIKNKPTLGSAAAASAGDFATAAQGVLADTAVQPGSLHAVATSGSYNDLNNKPTLVTESWVLGQIAAAELGEGGGEGDGGAVATALLLHTQDMNNPHQTTKAQVGLGNVQNVDQTNASNLATGAVNIALLPVGNTSVTVAAGNDSRFGLAESALQTVSSSGAGNVVTSVAKNGTDVVVTKGITALVASDLTPIESRLAQIENLGLYLGTVETKAGLPATVAAAQSLWGNSYVPAANDFADVLADETRGGAGASYRITSVSGGNITWASVPFKIYNTDTSGYMNKQSSATNGNIGTFNSAGQVVDSGKGLSDLATSAQGAKADSAVQPAAISDMATQTWVSGQVDTIPTSAPSGSLPGGRAFIWIE
ncbi:MAG: hypothetical protein FWF97_04470 [Alphaproteobacteria bacterium]|nr:hypothetical protein [Alphaproteobacteria bacterium]